MKVLTPKEALVAAQAVYDLKLGIVPAQKRFVASPSLVQDFNIDAAQQFNSKTGAFIKVKSGFGLIVEGKPDGAAKGELLIAIRGTDLAADWITDANIGIQTCESNSFVHAGFNRVFKEFKPFLEQYFAEYLVKNNRRPAMVHCVGHSLGGAVAGLTADWVNHNNHGDVKLYTYGSPRIGYNPFAKKLTGSLKSDNIYRVHHENDFVSLVPLWPFVHVPQPGPSYIIKNSPYNTFAAHKLANYATSIRDRNWEDLASYPYLVNIEAGDSDILRWLKTAGHIGLTMSGLKYLGMAIGYILKAAGVVVELGLILGITVLDLLSYALEKAVKISKEIAGWVEMLLRKILTMVGIVVKTINVTVYFIRWVFQLLNNSLRTIVTASLNEAK
jgi:triacylglycerol lipase